MGVSMILKDRVTVFRLSPAESDPYGVTVCRSDLIEVMVFEKKAVGADFRDEGKCVIYCFLRGSKVSAGELMDIQQGDLVVVGACRRNYDPIADDEGRCRRIVSVEERSCGTDRMHHLVIEAV